MARPRDAGARIQSALRLGGLTIALTQCAVLPVTAVFVDPDPPISPVAIGAALAMMGVAEAVKLDRARRRDREDDS